MLNYSSISYGDIDHLVENDANVRMIDMSNSTFYNFSGPLIVNCPNLEYIVARNSIFNNDNENGLLFKDCPNIKHIDMTGAMFNLSNRDAFFSQLNGIMETVNMVKYTMEHRNRLILSSGYDNIVTLNATGMRFSDCMELTIGCGCPNLRYANLSKCVFNECVMLKILNSCPKLVYVDLTSTLFKSCIMGSVVVCDCPMLKYVDMKGLKLCNCTNLFMFEDCPNKIDYCQS